MTTETHTIQPFLYFDGRTEEALEFYEKALGAEVTMMMRFAENPEPRAGCQPADLTKVMHAQFRVGNTIVMASDGRCGGSPNFQGFSLTLNVATPAEADEAFNALAEGGEVLMPLEKTFFSPRFGMLSDRFGINWTILTAPLA